MEASRLSFLKVEAFLERVKGKMDSAEYTRLLVFLDEFNDGKINVDELKELFNVNYPGLFTELHCVLSFSNELTRAVDSAESSNKVKEKPLPFPEVYEKVASNTYETKDHMAKALGFCQQVMKKTSSQEYLAFLKALSDYGDGEITIADMRTKIAHDFEAFRDDFDCVLDFYTNLNRPPSSSDSKKEMNKPNQELEKVKHSYRLRPIGNKPKKEHEKVKESSKHGPKRPSSSSDSEISNKGKRPWSSSDSEISNKGKRPWSSSGMDKKGKKAEEEVENVAGSYDDDLLPGYLSGEVNGSRGGGKKEQASDEEKKRKEKEDEQNRNEDVLFEMDMREAWMRSCKKNAIKLFEAINEGEIEEGIVKKHLTANNLAYIQKMYDADYGSRIVDHLLHSPQHVLPSIIKRLKQHDTSPLGPLGDRLEYQYFDYHDFSSLKPKYIFKL